MTCPVKGASCMCSGSCTSATKSSVNAPSDQQHHPSYDNAACAGSDISTACHPPSLYEESLTSTLTSVVGRDQDAAPKPDGLIRSNTTFILLASTPPMLPRWSMTDPQWKAFVCGLPTIDPKHGPLTPSYQRTLCTLVKMMTLLDDPLNSVLKVYWILTSGKFNFVQDGCQDLTLTISQ